VSEAFCFRPPKGVETYQINSLGITLIKPRDSQENRFSLRSKCLLKLSEAPPKECRLSGFYRTKIVVLLHPVVNPNHPRDPGLSAGGSEGISRDNCGRSRSFSWWFHRGKNFPLYRKVIVFPNELKRERKVFLTSRKVVIEQRSKSRSFHQHVIRKLNFVLINSRLTY
jgi:hypothetical protein